MASQLEEKYAPHFTSWKQQPDKATTGQLLKTLQPEIDRGISAHVGQKNPLIEGRARRIVLQALPKYDPNQARLGTYVVNQLQGLKRVSRQQQQIISIPERVQLDSNYLNRIETELNDKHDREPSLAELADASGISQKRIGYVRGFRYPISEGSTIRQTEEGGETPAMATQQENSATWHEMVYGDLDPTNQRIMEWALGLHGAPKLNTQQIAAKLKVTSGAISQRKAAIQRTLDQEAELNPL
jgi:DNA-directed RNA polymerase specialized sigma subunit